MRQLRLAEVDRIRYTPGKSLLLFLTDRCPVGCAHCSVDSRADSPTIRDFELFESIVGDISNAPGIELVGISGGEPFVERRGLTMATEGFSAAGKNIVLYTSGIWAGSSTPRWVREVLGRAACVFLSTDAFHANQIDDERFVRAARAIQTEGAWVVVQVLKLTDMIGAAKRLLERAFGKSWDACAELNFIPPLPYGRGASIFHKTETWPGSSFGACRSLAAPVVRYDGLVSACCNERVINGAGPQALRRRVRRRGDLSAAMHDFGADPFLRLLGGAGTSVVTEHPALHDLADKSFTSICELCWAAHRRMPGPQAKPDPLLTSMAWMVAKETSV
jgi:hypothetical protein